MYIPEFACGFILGAVVSAVLLIVISLTVASKDKKDEKDEK